MDASTPTLPRSIITTANWTASLSHLTHSSGRYAMSSSAYVSPVRTTPLSGTGFALRTHYTGRSFHLQHSLLSNSPDTHLILFFFFLNNPAPPEISPLPLPAPLPI